MSAEGRGSETVIVNEQGEVLIDTVYFTNLFLNMIYSFLYCFKFEFNVLRLFMKAVANAMKC